MNGCQQLVRLHGGAAHAQEELLEGQAALPALGAGQGDGALQRPQRGNRIVGWAGGDQIAGHRAAVADLRRAHLPTGLRQRESPRHHQRRRGHVVVRHQGTEGDLLRRRLSNRGLSRRLRRIETRLRRIETRPRRGRIKTRPQRDRVQPRDARDVDQHLLAAHPALQLDDQVGAAGDDARLLAVLAQQGQRLRQRCRLVVGVPHGLFVSWGGGEEYYSG